MTTLEQKREKESIFSFQIEEKNFVNFFFAFQNKCKKIFLIKKPHGKLRRALK